MIAPQPIITTNTMPPRFFCRVPLPRQHFPETIALDDECARHVRVLRLNEGDAVTLFDGEDGNGTRQGEATAFIKTIDKRTISVEISAWRKVSRESTLDIAIMQALATGDKMDLIIQKAVELGVTELVPLRTSRSTLKLDAERAEKRIQHWRGVAVAACEQCGRNVVPNVTEIQTIDEIPASTRCLGLLHPKGGVDRRVSLLAWAQSNAGKPLAIMVGPEGGFSDVEIAAAEAKGATVVTLGPRVLRTETAGLAALSILQSTLGDLG